MKKKRKKRNPRERTAPHKFERVTHHGGPVPEKAIFMNQFRVAEFMTDGETVDEVHLLLDRSDLKGVPVVVQFRTPDMLAVLIEELIAYRRAVWPGADEPNFDAEPSVASEEETDAENH